MVATPADAPSRASLFRSKTASRFETTPLKLPSGLTALVRRPQLFDALRDGLIPDSARAPLARYILDKASFVERVQADAPDPDERIALQLEMLNVVDAFAVAAFADPVVRFAPSSGDELALAEVDLGDRIAVWAWAENYPIPEGIAVVLVGPADAVISVAPKP